MDWIFIGYSAVVGLFIYIVGYFTGKNKAHKEFIKLLIKYKRKVPADLECGQK